MPPKPKVTKEIILEAAFQLVKITGIESVNARDVAAAIGCSTQPIFRVYTGMEGLKQDLYEYIQDYYYQFLLKSQKDKYFFFYVGRANIEFAIQDPNLYRMIFMSNNYQKTNLRDFINDQRNEAILTGMTETIEINTEQAKELFLNMWIYTHGIASMLTTNSLTLTNAEIEEMLSISYKAFYKLIKEGVDECEHTTIV